MITRPCRACASPVLAPRRVWCSDGCFAAAYGPAKTLSPRQRILRELVRLRERAAAIALRGKPHEPTPLTDGEPRVPTAIRARIDYLERWVGA